ncbi:hypothetical protein CHU98_g9511 [Xylaria longipes]|nr:hypothetical protein CHU98_g9511 [Xylaria longipes]
MMAQSQGAAPRRLEIVMASQWLGALPPPPGIEPNFIDPPSQRDRNIALHTVLLSLVTILLVVRLYTRVWITRMAFGVEDSYTRGIGRHIWDTPAPWLPEALMYFTIGSWIYLILTMTIKLTFLFFYRRLFSAHTKSRYFIDGAIIFVTLLNISLFFATIFICTPIQREWNPTIPGHCIDPVILPYFSGISSFLTDIYVLVMPIILLWRLNMRMQQKLKVASIFALGILACVSSLVRLIETPSLRTSYDTTWTISNIIVWAALEVNVGILCSCFITLPAFLDRHLPRSSRFFSRLFSFTSSKKPLDAANRRAGPSSTSLSKYNHLGESDSQTFVEEQRRPQNNVLRTNTFSLGEIHDPSNRGPEIITPWAGHTNDNGLQSTYVRSEATFA